MDVRPRSTSGCSSVLRLPDVHCESEAPSTSGEGERKFTESSLVYIIPDFPAGANFCRIFSLAPAGSRHSAAVSGRIFVSWPSEPGIPPAAFRTIISLYRDRRAKPPASHCTSFRLDRPALSRPPYLLYRANLGLPFVNNVSFQAPSAPAITFQEPQVNLPH